MGGRGGSEQPRPALSQHVPELILVSSRTKELSRHQYINVVFTGVQERGGEYEHD